jgi:hypothetical protein
MNSVDFEVWFATFVCIAGLLFVLLGLGIIACQALIWLQLGHWTSVEIRDGLRWLSFPDPAFEWRGVQKIAIWLLECPLSMASIFLGMALWFIGLPMVGKAYEARRAPERSR